MQSYANEIEWLKSKVSETPASMLYARLADRYLQIDEIDQAIEYAETSVRMHPHDATPRYVLAKCYFKRREYDNSNKHLKEALAADPNYLAALKLQGDLYGKLGEIAKVRENYDRIIDLDPFDDSVHQKIYDLQQTQSSATGTLKDDWNLDLSPDLDDSQTGTSGADESSDLKTSTEDESDFEPTDNILPQDYSDDPFTDFEESSDVQQDPFGAEEETKLFDDEARAAAEKEVREKDDDLSEKYVEPPGHPRRSEREADNPAESEYSEEEILDESIDDDFEIDRSKFKEEESKFTKLLDNIFSSNLDEEEKIQNEQRDEIERMANDSLPENEEFAADLSKDSDFEPLMNPEEIISPEEKILRNDREQRDELFDDNEDVERIIDEEEHIPEEFITRENEISDAAPPEPKTTFENNQESKSNDFSEFLDSLDIQDDEKSTQEDFNKSLTSDKDFGLKDMSSPLSSDDDWRNDMSAKDETASPESGAQEPESTEAEKVQQKNATENRADAGAKKTEEKNKGKFYTPTLGEIYAAQGQYAKAISVFETLIKNEPDNDWYQSKLDYLRKKLAEQ